MSLFTKPMKLLTAVVLKHTASDVSHTLLQIGALDFVDVSKLDTQFQSLENYETQVPLSNIQTLMKQLEALYAQANLSVPKLSSSDVVDTSAFDLTLAQKEIDKINAETLEQKNQQKQASINLEKYCELRDYLKENRLSFVDIRVGSFAKEPGEQRLSDLVCLYSKLTKNDLYIFVSLKRDSSKVNDLMDKFLWTESEDINAQKSVSAKALDLANAKCQELEGLLDKSTQETVDLIKNKKEQMDSLFTNLKIISLCTKIKTNFHVTENTAIFSAWVPENKIKEVEEKIEKVTNGKCIIEVADTSEVKEIKAPVSIQSHKVLTPFARIVQNYSTPEYGTINPTIFTTIAFMASFGLMFADVGQGLVILLIGLLLGRSYKKHPLKKDGLISRNLCDLLIFLGISSAICGVLFGSYFGFAWFEALWFPYHEIVIGEEVEGLVSNIYDILGVTIKFGFIIIVTGLVLNWINLIRKKEFAKLVMDKYGLLGGWIYIVGFFGCTYFVQSGYKTFPSGAFLPAVLIPAALMLFKGVLEGLLEKKKIKINFMEWLVDLLEVFSGYLSNTLSFMRVAGLGIAHVSLMNAFQMMGNMTTNKIFYVVIIILGNVLVIAIEGLSAGIQALRLNYYEFFTKFFTGKGLAYKPINIEK